MTSTCVLFTAAAAADRGFLVALVSDASASFPQVQTVVLRAYPAVFEVVEGEEVPERLDKWIEDLTLLELRSSE